MTDSLCREQKLADSFIPCVIYDIIPFQNNPKNLEPFYKMDLEFGIVVGQKKKSFSHILQD